MHSMIDRKLIWAMLKKDTSLVNCISLEKKKKKIHTNFVIVFMKNHWRNFYNNVLLPFLLQFTVIVLHRTELLYPTSQIGYSFMVFQSFLLLINWFLLAAQINTLITLYRGMTEVNTLEVSSIVNLCSDFMFIKP